jgi:hypothetical protein
MVKSRALYCQLEPLLGKLQALRTSTAEVDYRRSFGTTLKMALLVFGELTEQVPPLL